MKRRIRKAISNFILAGLTLVVGILIIKQQGYATQLGDWLHLSEKASLILGIVILFCGFYFLYSAIKDLRKSTDEIN